MVIPGRLEKSFPTITETARRWQEGNTKQFSNLNCHLPPSLYPPEMLSNLQSSYSDHMPFQAATLLNRLFLWPEYPLPYLLYSLLKSEFMFNSVRPFLRPSMSSVQTWITHLHTEIIGLHAYVPYMTRFIAFLSIYVQILEQCLAYSNHK